MLGLARILDRIWTQDFPNVKQVWYPLDCDVLQDLIDLQYFLS